MRHRMRGYQIVEAVLNKQYGGRMGGPYAAGPIGKCVCPKCGTVANKIRGIPCTSTKCPKCGTLMFRQGYKPVKK